MSFYSSILFANGHHLWRYVTPSLLLNWHRIHSLCKFYILHKRFWQMTICIYSEGLRSNKVHRYFMMSLLKPLSHKIFTDKKHCDNIIIPWCVMCNYCCFASIIYYLSTTLLFICSDYNIMPAYISYQNTEYANVLILRLRKELVLYKLGFSLWLHLFGKFLIQIHFLNLVYKLNENVPQEIVIMINH